MNEIYGRFEDLIQLPQDLTDFIWYEEYGTVFWNDNNNLNELLNSEDTYAYEVHTCVQRGCFVFFTLFDGGGNLVQSIFKLSSKIDPTSYDYCELCNSHYRADSGCKEGC